MPNWLRDKLLATGTKARFRPGQMIHLEGDVDASLSIIIEGSVKISRSNPEGEDLAVAVLGPGETYGEHPLFAGIPRTHDATALDNVTIIEVPKGRFFRLMDEEPELRDHALEAMTFRVIRALNMLDDERRLPANLKVAKYLVDQCDENAKSQTISVTQSQIADALNISRMTVSTVMRDLRSGNYIATGFGKIDVKDIEKLRAKLG